MDAWPLRSPADLSILAGPKVAPGSLSMQVFPAEDRFLILPQLGRGYLAWNLPFGAMRYHLDPLRDQSVMLARRPGRYVLYFFGLWPGHGDADYAVLVEFLEGLP